MSAENRVVAVTGGSRGLGLAVVSDLLSQGYRVVTCSRDRTTEIEGLEASHGEAESFLWIACRIGEEEDENNFFKSTIEWAGPGNLYGMVNNAAVAGEGVLATLPTVDAGRILAVNLLGPLRLSRLALRVMLRERTAGRIVNISSIVGLRGYTGLAPYSASKAGLDGLTRSLAREVGRRGITVNSVAPGYLETDLSSGLAQGQRQQIVNRTPLGRLGSVEDVVPVVRFLLSKESGFLTGQTIVIDGGLSC
jgi:3-oxoacyl-[acyl-carrier protein] reductase